MAVKVAGRSYYIVSEVSQLSGVNIRTIYRWMHKGIITGGKLQNRKGWTVFTEEDIAEIKTKAEKARKESD